MKIPPSQKKTIQKDINNNVIKIWDSCRLAGRELNIDSRKISKAALDKSKIYSGFLWEYESIKRQSDDLSLISKENEIWKSVKNYEDLYEVSNFGRVKSLIKDKILSHCKSQNDYCRVALYKNKNAKMKSVHRLVAESFLINYDNKPQVNHINCIKNDNNVNNLEWCTSVENNKHACGFKKINKGEENSSSKLTNNSVFKIREMYKTMSSRELAKIFNVDKSAILNIINGKTWKHI